MTALIALIQESLSRPRDAAARLIGMNLSREALWIAAALTVVLTPLSQAPVTLMVQPASPLDAMLSMPSIMIGLRIFVLAVLIGAFWIVARLLGGRAETAHIAVLTIWVEGLQLLLNFIVSLAFALQLIGIAQVLQFATLLLILWVYVQFLDVAAGFNSVWRSVAGVILAFLGLGLAGAFVLLMLGIAPAELSNV